MTTPENQSILMPINKEGFDLESALKTLPNLPGCYRYFDADHQCLYVGKARDLKKRVLSYFRKQTLLSPRIQVMVSQIAQIETTITRSEAEALLLENNLIKSLTPKYNIVFRDDKSYPYIKIGSEAFPRLSYYRGGVDRKAHYFGPYPNSGAVREAIQIMQKVFKLRTCENSVFSHRQRPCLLGQIGRCSAPCCQKITKENYQEDCQKAMAFLEGKTRDVVKTYEEKMWEASERWAFEEAALYRDRIASITQVQHQQVIETAGTDIDADIVALASEGATVCVNLAMVRGGRHLGDRAIFPKLSVRAQNTLPEKAEILEAFVSQHYVEQRLAPLLIVESEAYSEGLEEWLDIQKTGRTQIVKDPIGLRRRWLEMCVQGAQLALSRFLSQERSHLSRLKDLLDILEMSPEEGNPLQFKVECFDISHTSGEATQASCVVFYEGKMASHLYRRFNIEGVEPGDDYGAMRQVLNRRYQPVARGEATLPDIVLVDGGKGQVEVAREVFSELGLDLSVIVGVAKGEGRKTGLETLIFPEINHEKRAPLVLGVMSPALMLIAEIRDEAHRFAITGMRAKRDKSRQTSKIEDLPGIGPKRRAKLLTHFGGMRQLKNASVEDIEAVEMISKNMAQSIYDFLHQTIKPIDNEKN